VGDVQKAREAQFLAMANQEVLVALLQNRKDFGILQTEGWYRIPVEHTPRRWPPDFIAFYQPRSFGPDAFRVRYFGKIARIDQVERRSLFPDEFDSAKSNKVYHKIQLERLEPLPTPIPCRIPRKIIFIPTLWHKFILAEELNDLYDDSPLENFLWDELKQRKIPAERQWPVFPDDLNYRLDFAFFCNQGKLDVETDGDTYHIGKEKGARDNLRNNEVEALGWHTMHFNTRQIQERCSDYCVPKIQKSLTNLGGLVNDGLVPRKFFNKGGVSGQQLSLFEEKAADITELPTDDLD
jgi:very-short-patch-repair endonuclease